MAVKREDERYSSDPMDEISGIVEHVEGKEQRDGESPGLRMKVTGDARSDGGERGDRDERKRRRGRD